MEKNILTELQAKNMEAAMQLAQLAIDDSMMIQRLLSDLALGLVKESIESARALAQADSVPAATQLRADYVRRMTALMIEGARKLAEIGSETRVRFSRLLTERLASGSHDLLDAFQAFFRVLPSQKADAVEIMQQAIERSAAAFEHLASASAMKPARPRRAAATQGRQPPPGAMPAESHARL